MATILNVPGLWNSGQEHWHTYWERVLPNCIRVQQRDWDAPVCDEWIATLDQAVRTSKPPVVLAAHSMACATVAHWARNYGGHGVVGALLVAPSDVDATKYPKEPKGFAPMPLKPLPFPSIVVASEDDEWVSMERARMFADAWGSRFVNIGRAGHINSASKLGEWPEGQKLLRELLSGNAVSNSLR